MDEEIRKEKYLCTFKGSDGITFIDLNVKSTNPKFNKRVVLKYGEYLLTELLDFEDLKKSRTSGALNSFIKMGWVTVENSISSYGINRKADKEPVGGINEVQSGALKMSNVTNAIGNTLSTYSATRNSDIGFPAEVETKVVEMVSMEKSRTPNSFAVSEKDVHIEDSYTKFTALKYFQKLKTIKNTTDTSLLEAISAKSNYPQLVHNSKNRLRELKNK